MGYEIERGEHGQPEIRGYSREYMEHRVRGDSKSKIILRSMVAPALKLRRSQRTIRAATNRICHTMRCEPSIGYRNRITRSAAACSPCSSKAPRCRACPGRVIGRRS